jgi:8-oxo-dGTP pyrophosphatase MutT (NUDIX family)
MPRKGSYYFNNYPFPFCRFDVKKGIFVQTKTEREILKEFQLTIERLKEGLKSPLPGREAQMKMASARRIKDGTIYQAPENPRRASVLILLYPVGDRANLVFIQRNEYDGVHSGQISFPGGEKEPPDKTPEQTALREAWEETGISPESVIVIGELTELYIPPSNFMVRPIVGYCIERPEFNADPGEVQRVIEIGLENLNNQDNITVEKIFIPGGYSITAPCYKVDGDIIWGATAMILSELLEIIKQ